MVREPDMTGAMRRKNPVREREVESAALAGGQYGVISWRQLSDLGFSRGAVRHRIAAKRLHPLFAGAYAVGHPNVPPEGVWLAAVLASGDGAVLSHRSAAALWGILEDDGKPEVTVPGDRRSRGGIRRRTSQLRPDEVTAHRGIPVTTVARTLLDLAGVVTQRALERAIREAEYQRLVELGAIALLLDRHAGRRGARRLRRALAFTTAERGRTRSELEDRFRLLISKADLPRPELNATLELSAMTIEVDCLWLRHKLIVELDGHQAHGTRSAFERDRARDRAAIAAGFRVVRVTWWQLVKEPDALARDLRALLR